MKRTVLLLLAFSSVFAQEKPAAAEAAKPEAAKEETPAAEGALAPESLVRGSVEVGYRFLGDIGGSENVYRSIVNLGEGPRLLNADLFMTPSLKWIDELSIRANNWGGDPYNTAGLRARKQGWYEVNVDYRNIAYFNNLPSFANPQLETGLLQSQRAFDTTRRFADVSLDLLPGRVVTPFFGYSHNSGFGNGITLFVPRFNEYPVPTVIDDRTDMYRGGVRIETRVFHATLEAGRFDFRDDQRVFENTRNTGNRTTPFQGQQLVLRDLMAQYNTSGDAAFTRIYVTANPVSFLDFYGSWVWMRPDLTTTYVERATGNFAVGTPVRFLPTQELLFNALAKQPHNRAHFGFELRPTSRVRIIQSFFLDRLFTDSIVDRLDVEYQQNQIEMLVNLTNRLTLRAGHRYTWGQSETRPGELLTTTNLQSAKLQRNTALAGLSYRWGQKLSANVDTEVARGDRAYFRTSLRNYERIRARLRYNVTPNLQLGWNGSYLNNDSPNRFSRVQPSDYDLRTLDHSYFFMWTPAGGSRFRAVGEYSRLNWESDIFYLAPQDLVPLRSFNEEHAHAGSLAVDFIPARGNAFAPRFTAGGSFVKTTGTRPTRYLQPMIRAAFPIYKHIEFIGEWRYFGLTQSLYTFEHFRNNQATLSLRFWQ